MSVSFRQNGDARHILDRQVIDQRVRTELIILIVDSAL